MRPTLRQVILDTETTGLEHAQGHRIIEIGCIELVNRRITERHFHKYLCPDREIDEGALKVHGITSQFLKGQPRFAEVAEDLLSFIDGAQLIIHNATFDVGFLDAEFARLTGPKRTVAGLCDVLDTLILARQMHPGQRNSLDALCKRYFIDNSRRELHGALLDARILADVYLAMTGGQVTLTLDSASGRAGNGAAAVRVQRPVTPLMVVKASDEELAAHDSALAAVNKASGGRCVWLQPAPVAAQN